MFLGNCAVLVAVGLGIYSFSGSAFGALVGAVVITGMASQHPATALATYPAVEYFLGNGLTVFSAIVVSITLVQVAFIFGVAAAMHER